MTAFLSRRAFLFALPAALTVAEVATAGFLVTPVPDGLDLSLSRLSNAGLYRAELVPDAALVAVGKMLAWTVVLRTAAGAPVTKAEITISGGMPQHGHGLPTAPQVTRNLGDGRYLIEGVKFNMGGWWTFTLDLKGAAGRDAVTFNLVL